ncbi:MAG TPA: PilZ domain-containing protein [Acidimicrobiales bacterium]|nr:PilZ domain-containing protein [Acidimicrobiales bacterium]
MDPNVPDLLLGSPLGRYVTVFGDESPAGVAYVAVGDARDSLVLRPVRSGATPGDLAPGAHVRCSSAAGEWSTTVRSTRAGTVELALPRWLAREARRRFPRVRTDESASIGVDGGTWAAKLLDVSVGGAAALVERGCGLREGQRIAVSIGDGESSATVRAVREHAHPMLVVVGVAWHLLDPPTRAWVAAQVARSAVTAPASPTQP